MDLNESLIERLGPNDRAFLMRVFENGIDQYKKRILQLGFCGTDTVVLDAGCGFGQWSLSFAQCNKNVVSIEYSHDRVSFLQDIVASQKITNIKVLQGSIENLPQEIDECFDYVFCYGVLFLTNWKESLQELLRVTKKGGYIYIAANDIGWYYNLIINEPNKTTDYNPRQHGIDAFINEYRYNNGEKFEGDRVLRLELFKTFLEQMPPAAAKQRTCQFVLASAEGTLIYDNGTYKSCLNEGFFKAEYFGARGVYEVILQKSVEL